MSFVERESSNITAAVTAVEVSIQQRPTDAEVYVEVVVASIMPKEASRVMELFCDVIPLQRFGLSHLKRIRPSKSKSTGALNVDANSKAELQIIVCPVKQYESVPESVKNICTRTEVIRVAQLEPMNRAEHEEWGKSWPTVFHISHSEKNRELGLSEEDQQQLQHALVALRDDELELSELTSGKRVHAGVVVNPLCGKVVVSSSTVLRRILNQYIGPSAGESPTADDHHANPATSSADRLLTNIEMLYTPTMLCIEGVAAMVRGEDNCEGTLAGSSGYLCTGLDLYLTGEPDLMSSMALVHSRIRRVFYARADGARGALGSGKGHIHCMRALNHHYRAFRVLNYNHTESDSNNLAGCSINAGTVS